MNRRPLLPLLVVLAACATAPAPTTTSTATTTTPTATTAAADCNAGMPLLNGTVWMQTAAEYRASALQTYANARRALDAALADPAWTAEPQQTGAFGTLPPAVILDLDETAIDNSAFEARVIRAGKTYDAAMWKQWVDEAAAHAIPGVTEFLAYAKSRGVTPFYITNRDDDEEPGTRRNLEKLGFPLGTTEDTLLTRGERPEWKVSDKGPRRAHVAARYRVLLLLGDDLNDFANARDKSRDQRDRIITDTAQWWGTRWFILPNPLYGSWERAITGGTGTPCEQLQKKMDALRP